MAPKKPSHARIKTILPEKTKIVYRVDIDGGNTVRTFTKKELKKYFKNFLKDDQTDELRFSTEFKVDELMILYK